jgi:hypothetical protein
VPTVKSGPELGDPEWLAPIGRTHMARIVGIFIAVIVLIVVIYPFAQDAYHRYLVSDRLKTVMTSQERAEFNNWTGDAMSFATRLYQRCELQQGKGAVQCDRYKFAMELR